jgi:hypothetical protein
MTAVGTFTVAFLQPSFTVQLQLASVADSREAIEQSFWFQSEIGSFLGLSQDEPAQHFQLQELDGLVNTWSGFIGHNGVYANFILVRACNCVPTEPGQAYVAFVP